MGPAPGIEPALSLRLARRLTPASLPARVIAVVAVLTMVMLGLAALGLYRLEQSDLARAEAGLRVQARSLAVLIDGPFENAETALRIEANHPALKSGDLAAFEVALREATADTGAPFALYDSNSVHLINTAWAPGYRPAGPVPFGPAMQAITSGQIFISDMIRSSASGKLVIPVELPIPEGGPVQHVLGTMVFNTELQKLLTQEQTRHDPQWAAYVIDRSGTIVAHSRDPAKWVGKPAQLHPGNANEGFLNPFIRSDQTPGTIAFARAARSGYVLAVMEPQAVFQAAVHATLRHNIELSAMLLLGGLTVAGLLAGSVVVSLRRLNGQLEATVGERTAELAASEARLRAFWENSPEALLLMQVRDDGSFMLLQSNPTHRAWVGQDFAVPGPRGPRSVFPPEQAELLLAQHRQCVAQGQPVRHNVTLDYPGGRREVETMLVPLRDADGAIRHIIASVRDMSERNTLQAELAQAQKMQALGQRAGGIAHDINTVLQAILGSATMIVDNATDIPRNERLARRIVEAATRGSAVTHRLLAFSRRGELRTTVVPPTAVLDSLSDMLEHILGTSICVIVQADTVLPDIRVDRSQLETVLVNLATNARDAMPNGGTLHLSATLETVKAGETVGADLAPGDYVRFAATDTGIGMDAETMARITEPFFTTKPGGHGTGLGLSMACGFAEQSGGTLRIESALGSGTSVFLWLPLDRKSEEEAAPASPARLPGIGFNATGLRVLVVEDDPLVRDTLQAQLESVACRVTTAASGEVAIALLRANADIDVMVTDLAMPDMSGIEVIRWARALHPHLPAILLTGHPTEQPRPDLPGVIWLQKPIGVGELTRAFADLPGIRGENADATWI